MALCRMESTPSSEREASSHSMSPPMTTSPSSASVRRMVTSPDTCTSRPSRAPLQTGPSSGMEAAAWPPLGPSHWVKKPPFSRLYPTENCQPESSDLLCP